MTQKKNPKVKGENKDCELSVHFQDYSAFLHYLLIKDKGGKNNCGNLLTRMLLNGPCIKRERNERHYKENFYKLTFYGCRGIVLYI